jgi:CD2 antigen cytoplasmic tail-binding protein 2
MKEELEEGHFDADGHYHWKKDQDLKDNWLDNIDWVKIKKDSNYKEKNNAAKGRASSDSDTDSNDEDGGDQSMDKFDSLTSYRSIFALMLPTETIKRSIKRIGGTNVKLSTVERIRRKKAGIVDESATIITKLTELSNEILTRTGNMDIYEETYEQIQKKISAADKKNEDTSNLDMYADDFDDKEKEKFGSTSGTLDTTEEEKKEPLMWEYKINSDDVEIHGPFDTEQMQKWVQEKHFKKEIYVRKCGIVDDRFYSSHRIDFELYL